MRELNIERQQDGFVATITNPVSSKVAIITHPYPTEAQARQAGHRWLDSAEQAEPVPEQQPIYEWQDHPKIRGRKAVYRRLRTALDLIVLE